MFWLRIKRNVFQICYAPFDSYSKLLYFSCSSYQALEPKFCADHHVCFLQSSDDNEPSEEEDRFVAQLYKFCDDRGTPINKAPSVGSKDLNLYKLFKIVQKLGGYNRVILQY